MRVLVTGGSGYLGTHVRNFFNADDFSRRSGHDITNPDDLGVISDYDVIIHLAAHLDKDPDAAETCFRTNADGAANVIKAMNANSVFIYASTKDVYGAHAGTYDEVPEQCPVTYSGQTALEWSKLIGERYVEYYGRRQNVRTCIFRMSTVYARPSDGNESGFVTHYVESVKHRWPIRLPVEGLPVRDILHVDDFSRACKAFIDSSHVYGLYNLGGGKAKAITLRGLVATIGDIVQISPVTQFDDTLPAPVPLSYISDLRRVNEQLSWSPQIGIEEGIRSLL